MTLGLLVFAAALGAAALPVERIWEDPGPVESMDFSMPAAGLQKNGPQPPFHFVREEMGGTSPKVIVKDAAGVLWRVKGGLETRPEAFVTRLVAAMGYYTEPTHFVAHGRIDGVQGELRRASGFLKSDGSISYVTYEHVDPNTEFVKNKSWTWESNPFTGTNELAGLKILMMLVSNWDNKDSRDKRLGSNTAVVSKTVGNVTKHYYTVTDWGQTLGSWSRWWHIFGGRQPWNCEAFSRQTLVTARSGRIVRFGFEGQHTDDFRSGITVDNVRWLLGRLGKVTDEQLRAGLRASGASTSEQDCFTRALRTRIEQLQNVSQAQ
ncbi:MAG TPA: hypothetical protein VEQ63_04140 [Bryobacteraceae bacterium]|nr:hypothetical protein [Bryobacteraceae bacterium]